MYRRNLANLIDKEANLLKELRKFESESAKANESAHRYADQARRSSNLSSVKTALNSCQRETEKAIQAGKKAADIKKQIANNARDQAQCRYSLENSEKNDQRLHEQKVQKLRREEKAHAIEIARISSPKVHYVHIKPPEQEKLRVLYLLSNPGMDLRTDVEFRMVQQSLRGAKYRDLITIEQRPAATFQDLMDGLNDVNPHIVHFSGHGGKESIVMDGGITEAPTENKISFQLLFKALSSTDSKPTLLLMNACDTLEGAEEILPAVPVIIAMSDNVLDISAISFAGQFYAALASGQSVGSAFQQGKVSIEATMIDDASYEAQIPECITRDDVDISSLKLVKTER